MQFEINSSAYEVFYTIYTMIREASKDRKQENKEKTLDSAESLTYTAQNLYVYFILDVIDDLVLKVKKVSTRFFVLNEAPDVIVEPLKF
ncbi:hypothetical protein T02_14447 [Trichinella nativa]|uniref:Uncharacterized protein n=2 Tax=Trichinella TaxID=6333 RepID=A0A0V1KXK6_9BILA|nr:hypothetical protein T03_6191 [Trichinella britovi]KRZ51724.1 hypothetical protein T02_14447 [Trichinella nativa]